MASLELVDHTQELVSWHLPQQQHGARQPGAESSCAEPEASDEPAAEVTAE